MRICGFSGSDWVGGGLTKGSDLGGESDKKKLHPGRVESSSMPGAG